MNNGWIGLIFPLWLALLVEPTKENKKITEKPKKVIKIKNKKNINYDTTLVLKIENNK